MKYKNGIKEYAVIGFASGMLYWLLTGLVNGNMKMSFGLGLLYGAIITLILLLFMKYIEKKSESLRAEISKDRRIICEGPASHKEPSNVTGGWLFLTEDAIEFYPRKSNAIRKNIPIFIDEIRSVETKLNVLTIYTRSGESFFFIVNKANCWKQSITEML